MKGPKAGAVRRTTARHEDLPGKDSAVVAGGVL
jgi:hypothetical protein